MSASLQCHHLCELCTSGNVNEQTTIGKEDFENAEITAPSTHYKGLLSQP